MGSKDQQLYQDIVDIKPDLEQPEGWEFPKIGDILEINYGKGLKKSDRSKGNVPVYGSNGVVGEHNSALTEGQTIIIGRKGTVGAVNFSSEPCWPIDTTYFIDKFYGLVPQFLFYAMRSLNLGDLDTSTAIPGINRNDIYKQQIPVPPVPEQKRIVAKVVELLERVNAVRERLARVKEILKRFRQSVLSAACSGRFTEDWRECNPNVEHAEELLKRLIINKDKTKKFPIDYKEVDYLLDNLPEKWLYVNMKNIVESIKYGTSKKCDYDATKIPILRIPNIINGYIDLNDIKYAQLPSKEYEQLKLVKDDILMVRSNGSVALIGKTALVTEKVNNYAYAGYLIRLRFNSKMILPSYINLALSTYKVRFQIEMPARSTSGVHNINSTEVGNLNITLPPLEEQHEIVRRVETFFKLADVIEKCVAAANERAERLAQAILAKAFRGELVPTEAEQAQKEGRSYESADILLYGIRGIRGRTSKYQSNINKVSGIDIDTTG